MSEWGSAPFRRQRQAGFVITVELLLIFTVVVIAVVVALAAVRNALLDSGVFLRRPLVFDSSATPRLVGKVLDLDDSEAARVLRRDPNNGLPVLLGVRVDRFASHTPIFYALDGCLGAAYVHDPSSFGAVLDPEVEERFGFFDELQGVVYAVGAGGTTGPASPFGPGLLYRNDPGAVSGAGTWNASCAREGELPDMRVRGRSRSRRSTHRGTRSRLAQIR